MSGPTLRPSIEQALSIKKWSLVKLAKETGINRSVFSNTLRAKDPTPISFGLLKKTTLALEYAEDYFFESYIDECFLGGKSNKSRVRPFLIRCGELGKTDYIERVLERLEAENEERHWELIFEIAEEFARSGNDGEALPLYHWIAKLDKSTYSERIAVSQYRIFKFSIGQNDDENLRMLERFVPFRHGLPDTLKLQALLEAANIYLISNRIGDVGTYADEMIDLCFNLFGTKDKPSNPRFDTKYPVKKPFVYFYGHAHLLRENAFEAAGFYEKALSCHVHYADLEWFPNSYQHADHARYIETFKLYARVNRYNLMLLLGDRKILDDYADVLEKYPYEILPSTITVLTAAEKFDLVIDDFLIRFSTSLNECINSKNNPYNALATRTRYVLFLQKLSTYHYNRGRHEEALQAAIQSWELSKTTNNHSHLRMLASLAVMHNTVPAEQHGNRTIDSDNGYG